MQIKAHTRAGSAAKAPMLDSPQPTRPSVRASHISFRQEQACNVVGALHGPFSLESGEKPTQIEIEQ